MGIKGFIVRLLPFVGTFALGLFVASFFVNIGAMSGNNRRGRFHEMKRLQMENEDLRNENLRLRNELESIDRNSNDLQGERMIVVPNSPKRHFAPVPPLPPAPAVPVSPRAGR